MYTKLEEYKVTESRLTHLISGNSRVQRRRLFFAKGVGSFLGEGRAASLNNGKGNFDTIVVPNMTVEIFDGGPGLCRVRHEDETPTSSQMIEGGQDHSMLYRAILAKQRLELVGGGVERKVEDVQVALCTFAASSHH